MSKPETIVGFLKETGCEVSWEGRSLMWARGDGAWFVYGRGMFATYCENEKDAVRVLTGGDNA